jgi:hypothetical protein
MTSQQRRKLEQMNENMGLMLDCWITSTDINPAEIPFPNAHTIEYGCYTTQESLNPKPDRIYDASSVGFRQRGNLGEHPHLKYDGFEEENPYFIFRAKTSLNSTWYDLIEVAAKLHTRSTDWHHHGFNSIEPHPQYDDVLTLYIDS